VAVFTRGFSCRVKHFPLGRFWDFPTFLTCIGGIPLLGFLGTAPFRPGCFLEHRACGAKKSVCLPGLSFFHFLGGLLLKPSSLVVKVCATAPSVKRGALPRGFSRQSLKTNSLLRSHCCGATTRGVRTIVFINDGATTLFPIIYLCVPPRVV